MAFLEMIRSSPMHLLFALLCGHAFADFALQNEWVATNKNRHVRLRFNQEQQQKMQVIWPYLLSAHSLHHGFFVFAFTQSIWLGLAETGLHWLTDFGKCENFFGFHTDQLIHIFSKVLWVYLFYA